MDSKPRRPPAKDLGDGWMELQAVLRAPTGGLIRVRAYGLSGCEIRFRFGNELTEARILREALAEMQRPVQLGDHDIAVQWRGCANEDDIEFGYKFSSLVTTLAELEREAPDVASVMKKNNAKGAARPTALTLSPLGTSACGADGHTNEALLSAYALTYSGP